MSTAMLRILVVEDEVLIRMMVTEMLEELGHTIAAEAGKVDNAIDLARSANFDLAILDVNLGGEIITPVAEVIKTRGLPIIFATGYGAWGVPDEFSRYMTLQKPFELKTLGAAIEKCML
jgi:CheY-like chemotaxis protein